MRESLQNLIAIWPRKRARGLDDRLTTVRRGVPPHEPSANDLEALKTVLIMTPSGAQIPLGEVAVVELAPGPNMISDEDGQLTGYV